MTWDWVVPVALTAGIALLWLVIFPRLGVKT
jgi:hypothetical protein